MNSGNNFVLALETAIDGGSVTLFSEGRIIGSLSGSRTVSKSEDILLLVKKLLEQCEVQKNAIKKIVISDGPGSLTGIRIGLATAKGLSNAFSAELEVKGLLESLVLFNKKPGKIAVCLFSPKNNTVYFEQFRHTGKLKAISLNDQTNYKINDFISNFGVLTEGAEIILFSGIFENMMNGFFDDLDFRQKKEIIVISEELSEILVPRILIKE